MIAASEFVLKASKTTRYHARRALLAARGLQWDLAPRTLRKPIFVVGCSRAGTTVVYKTFSESRELGSLQKETHDFWSSLHPLSENQWRTHSLGASDAGLRDREIVSRYFFSHTGRLRVVDKNNQNGLCLPYLHALFPDAHFVYVKRSPGDNIHSLIEGWGRAEEFATWSNDLPVRVAIDGGRYTRWCFFLFEGWQRYAKASIEEVCAAQYVAMNEAILEASKAIPAPQWTEIQYEHLVQDPVQAFRSAFQACGLQMTRALKRHCETVLSKPYNAFSAIRLDKWREQGNRSRIERVMPTLLPVAGQMGYAI